MSDQQPGPTNLAGLDHLPSIDFNALSAMGICWAMWGVTERKGATHFCWAYRAFPHVCRSGNPDHLDTREGT